MSDATRLVGREEHYRGTPVIGGSIRAIVVCLMALTVISIQHDVRADGPKSRRGFSFSGLTASKQRKEVINSLPLNRLTPNAQQRILKIAKSPTLYRRLPTQDIRCDKNMFLTIGRNPEILVGMWEMMGITQVQTKRIGPYQLQANDGAGTTCTIELIYGDQNTHIFFANGQYDGKMTTKPIYGQGVFVLRSRYGRDPSGETLINGQLDCFVQFDNFGADLVVRTLGAFIGRAADSNFIETAKFVEQVSKAAEDDPSKMISVAKRLPQVPAKTRQQFATVIAAMAKRQAAQATANASESQQPRSAVRSVSDWQRRY